jgi:pyruvate/2-oxoglutarate/acetoin dehydrogenase E1 component
MTKIGINSELTYAESILSCMNFAMESKSNSILMGQGIGDHKGIFGTTTGMVEKFGSSRVIESPIAEEMMTGFGLGASLNGLYPIMTHIRADFSFVAMNQIVNLYAKYKYMFGGQFKPSGLIRMIVGRSWGQGAQHAQSPQSIFSHIPGIRVIMPYSAGAILENYIHEIKRADRLVISLEHRNLYDINFKTNSHNLNFENPHGSKIESLGSDLTIVATSIMVLESLRAAAFLKDKYGLSIEVIDMTSTSNPDSELIFSSVSKTGRLLIADTSWSPFGVGSEISRLICERDPSILIAPIKVVGMEHTPCPTGKTLEDIFYPSVRTIVEKVLVTCGKQIGELPDGESYRDYYRKFKGPF